MKLVHIIYILTVVNFIVLSVFIRLRGCIQLGFRRIFLDFKNPRVFNLDSFQFIEILGYSIRIFLSPLKSWGFTKPLSEATFTRLVNELGMVSGFD